MLAILLQGYSPSCVPNTGGISRIWVFDPADMNFTQAAAGDPYTAVANNAGASPGTGGGFWPITFDYLEGQIKSPLTVKGSSQKFSHALTIHVAEFGNDLTTFLTTMQNATTCASLAFIIEQNNGHVMVMGEAWVNGVTIPRFRCIMTDGTETDSGKAFDDMNGATVVFKADYGRSLIEFTGGIDAIIALQSS